MITTLSMFLMISAASAGDLDLAGIPELPEATLAEMATDPDWQVRHRAALARAWRADAAAAQALDELAPGDTRAGTPRLILPADRAHATAVLLERYLRGTEDEATRVALVDALPRTPGEWAPGLAASVAREPSPAVRTVMVEALRREDPALVAPVLRAALADADAGVRAAAARSMGWSGDADRYTDLLVGALADTDAAVRADAARALGWLHAADAWGALVGSLADRDGLVRLHTLRALQRIDAERAGRLPQIAAMVSDPDAKVARAAGQIAPR